MAIRVVLAEDNYLVREGVRKLVDSEPDLDVVGVCEDYDTLLATAEAEQPDVVVTDIRMPPTGTDEGIRAAAVLRERHPHMGVVVLSQYSEPAYALSFLDGGSKGRAYLLKERVSDIGQLAG
ncbi:MAG TPA: response regulator transcription factor, partial [Acidimicrobiales bacterium]